MSLIQRRFLMNIKAKESRVKIQSLVIIMICGLSTSVFALDVFPKEKAANDSVKEIKNNNKTTVLVGMSEEQRKGFEQTWERTRPRWEAQENAWRFEKRGLINEAIEEHKKAIANSENDFYAETSHRSLANLYEKSGQYEAALKEVDWYIVRFKKMNYPNKDLLKEYEQTRKRLLLQIKPGSN